METQIAALVAKYFSDGIKGKLPPPVYGFVALLILALSVAMYSAFSGGDVDVQTTDNAANTAINATVNQAEEAESAVNAVLDFSVSDHVESVEEGITTEVNGKASDDTPFLE